MINRGFMQFKQVIIAITLFMLSAVFSQCIAGIIYFTDRIEFEDAVGSSLSFENFNGAFSTAIDVSGYKKFYDSSSLVSEGDKALGVKESNTVTFNFSHDVFALGFDVNELNSTSLSYLDSAGHAFVNALLASDPWDASNFFGILSDTALSSFSLSGTSDSNTAIYGIDALAFTAAPTKVPSPTSLSIFLLSLVSLHLYQRKTH